MKLMILVIVKIWFWSKVFIKGSFSSMLLLNDLLKLDSSEKYLNLNFKSPKSKFEVAWHLQWKFEIKPFL